MTHPGHKDCPSKGKRKEKAMKKCLFKKKQKQGGHRRYSPFFSSESDASAFLGCEPKISQTCEIERQKSRSLDPPATPSLSCILKGTDALRMRPPWGDPGPWWQGSLAPDRHTQWDHQPRGQSSLPQTSAISFSMKTTQF